MEIKASLSKPYTEEQRIDFIVQQNHQNGYEIRETDLTLEAWGYTQEEQQEQQQEQEKRIKQQKIQELNIIALDYIRIGDDKAITMINDIISGLSN